MPTLPKSPMDLLYHRTPWMHPLTWFGFSCWHRERVGGWWKNNVVKWSKLLYYLFQQTMWRNAITCTVNPTCSPSSTIGAAKFVILKWKSSLSRHRGSIALFWFPDTWCRRTLESPQSSESSFFASSTASSPNSNLHNSLLFILCEQNYIDVMPLLVQDSAHSEGIIPICKNVLASTIFHVGFLKLQLCLHPLLDASRA